MNTLVSVSSLMISSLIHGTYYFQIIKPGFDLKNRIVSLLEEKLQSLRVVKNYNYKPEEDVCVQVNLPESSRAQEKEQIFSEPEHSQITNLTYSVFGEHIPKKQINIVTEKKYSILKEKSSKKRDFLYPINKDRAVDDTTFKRNIKAFKESNNFPTRAERYDTLNVNIYKSKI